MSIDLIDEIHNVLSGKIEIRFGGTLQTIANYLSESKRTGKNSQNGKHLKSEEAKKLISFARENQLFINDIDVSQYVSEGAEQKVYLKGSDHVIKLNDGIYYESWKDYFFNLILHKYFFSDTAYEFLGFTLIDNILYAIVKQSFVTIISTTKLEDVNYL